MTTPDNVLRFIAGILSDAKLPHALIGGHAVNAFLPPRFTADVDITVQASPGAVARVRLALEEAGYRVTTEHGAGLSSGPDFVRFSREPGDPPIELQSAKTEFQKVVIERAIAIEMGPSVATVEDLIVLKLIANRPKDLADLAGLLELSDVDWGYVEKWAAQWDVLDLLMRLRNPG